MAVGMRTAAICGCFLILLVRISTAILDIRMPPTFLKEPIRQQIYREDAPVEMDCEAAGLPRPEYLWKRNGRDLELNKQNIQRKTDGSGGFTINPAATLDEGYYQCVAHNMYGTVVSNTSVLRKAQLGEGDKSRLALTAVEGQPFHLPVVLPRCFPQPVFSWVIGREVDEDPRLINTNRRIQISHTGELHFAFITREDATRDDFLYKLNVFNSHRDIRAATNYIQLSVTSVVNISTFAPTVGFTSSTPVIAVEGRNVTLRCFFYGNPEPRISWTKSGGSIAVERTKYNNLDTEMTIQSVEQSDQGDYICTAQNFVAIRTTTIQIDVQAAPVFRAETDRPHNCNVTEGESLTFQCNAYAEPAARVVWMRNGEPLRADYLPPKFTLSNGDRSLTISNLCKNCSSGEPYDQQVIQCNASNVHGYALGTGYINVLLKTKLANATTISVSVNTSDEARFEFRCSARSDDSTPVTIRWYKMMKDEQWSVISITNRLNVSDNGSLIIQMPADDNEGGWVRYGGTYKCRASNGFSDDNRTVIVTVVDKEPDAEPLATGGLGDYWWIFIIIAAVFLLLILLIFCCIYLQRNKGDTYPVDQKERKNGNDPEKELLGYGFQDYQRPSENKLTNSRGSLGSHPRLNSDDDGGSMNEYGDVDPGKFNEDGSFVGLYNTVDRKLNGRSGSLSNM